MTRIKNEIRDEQSSNSPPSSPPRRSPPRGWRCALPVAGPAGPPIIAVGISLATEAPAYASGNCANDYTIGAFEANFEAMAAAVDRARAAQVDLVVFTELATVGYPPGDLLDRREFVDRNIDQLERVARLSDEVPASWSVLSTATSRGPASRSTMRSHCATAARWWRAATSACSRATTCLTRPVTSNRAHLFERSTSAGSRSGSSVCEDVWADPDLDGLRASTSSDPVLELIHRGAQILINLSASPFELGKAAERRELIPQLCRGLGPLLRLRQPGGR